MDGLIVKCNEFNECIVLTVDVVTDSSNGFGPLNTGRVLVLSLVVSRETPNNGIRYSALGRLVHVGMTSKRVIATECPLKHLLE
jgi:hypothetical protein